MSNIKSIKKVALITGITGQDGSYLTELLLSKNYDVHGVVRRSSGENLERIAHLLDNKSLILHNGELTDFGSLLNIIKECEPDEIYNLAAQSHVQTSFGTPEFTADTDALGALRILEAIKSLNLTNKTRFYQASTSEMFGKVQGTPQTESTPFYPQSPYAIAKLYAHWITINYRESYNMFACSGILFNHESPRRGEDFVTSKIVLGVHRFKKNNENFFELGNLNTLRDWGHAKDYVHAMWLMLQQETPKDYIISTGKQRSVRDFVEAVAKNYELKINWVGEGIREVGVDAKTGKEVVKINSNFFRPSEVVSLLGDPSLAIKDLGWRPNHSFDSMVKDMCDNMPARFPNYSNSKAYVL